MQQRQFSHHLRQQIGEFIAISHARQQRLVFAAHRQPIHAMQLRVVKPATMQAPRIDENLPPVFARLHAELPIIQAHLRALQFRTGRRLRPDVDDEQLVATPAPQQHLAAITGQRKLPDISHVGFRRRSGVIDQQRFQMRAALRRGVSFEQPQAATIAFQARVIAGGQRHFKLALCQAFPDDGRCFGTRPCHGKRFFSLCLHGRREGLDGRLLRRF